jgi:hypothetical protein
MDKLFDNIKNNSELFISSISFIVALFSLIFGIISLCIQRSHNKKSVLPLGFISLANYENLLRIKIINNGVGPLIIQNIKTYKNKEDIKNYPIEWFENDNIIWSTFRKNLEEYSIAANSESILLEYKVDLSNKQSIETRDIIRNKLKDLTITIEYNDIYNKKYKKERKLSWFSGNHE